MLRSWTRFALLIVAVLAAALLLTACDTNATTTASCGFVVGDGHSGHDAKLHRVVYPGQSTHVGDSEDISYVPCNSRNYLINDGSVFNANGEQLGDRHQLIEATTKTGVPINIAVSAYWTLNQSESAMRAFYNVCFKYRCASSKDTGGDVNFATPGWNGMLAEDFGPALDRVARLAAVNVEDSIWQLQNPEQYQTLSDAMSAGFADVIRATLGYQDDLFCGSGNSVWSDPNKPGEGEFTCSPVRIVVDKVERGEIQADESTEGVLTINQMRLSNATALYGPDAGYWLGLQDTIEKCKTAGTTCIINIGGGPVAVPTNQTP